MLLSTWSVVRNAVLCLGVAGVCAASAASRPNIVVFIADDLTARDISPYGGTEIPTPNSAAVAREGLALDRAYAASPTCAPSRAALLTGLYPAHNGALFNQQAPRRDVPKWPSYFQKLGYEVVAIGKVAHYAQVRGYGFDYAAFFGYHQDICIQKAVEWLGNRKSDKPLCLLVGTNWPHVPWPVAQALPPQDVKLAQKLADTPETRAAVARYDSAVKNADRDLGMIWDAAHRYLPGDTAFIFSADQGAQFPFVKWNLYEPALRVPFIAVWPGHIQPGTRSSAMVSWVDVLPTLLEIAGADPKTAAADIDGRSFLPVLLGKTNHFRDAVFASHSGDGGMNYYPSRSVTTERWKYIRNLDPTLEFHTHIDKAPQDTGFWPSWVSKAATDPSVAQLVSRYYHRPAEELYDLQSDPHELENLAVLPEHADDLVRLRQQMDGWMRSVGDRGIATDVAARPKQPPTTPDP